MEKIFKKSLAIMVSAAICLTALIGCLTVSAERGEGTITVGTVEGKAGESVTVPITLAYTDTEGATAAEGYGIAAALFDVQFDPSVLTIASIAAADVTETADYTIQYRTTDGSTPDVRDGVLRFIAEAKGEVSQQMIVNITFTVAAEATAGASAVTIVTDTLQACDYGTVSFEGVYANDEDMITMSATNGSVTVAEDQTCEHNNLEYVSSVPATEEANGTIIFECADCGEQVTESVTYLAQSTLAVPTIGCTSTTQLILRAGITANAAATDSVLIVTHKFMNGAPDEITTYTFEDAETDDTTYRWSIGVPSINYTDIFSTVLYTKRDGQWVSGMVRDFSIQNAAMSTIEGGNDEAIKLVCGNLLTMGAKAQIEFDYNPSALADAELVDYPQYVTSTIPTVERNEDNFISVGSDFAAQKKAAIATPSIALGDSIAFNLRVVTSYYEGATDDLKVVVNYESFNGAPISETYNINYVDGTAVYNLSVGVIAPNMRQPVSFTVYNGDTAISDTAVYSIESVLASAVSSDPTVGDLVNAIINYSDSAKEAF